VRITGWAAGLAFIVLATAVPAASFAQYYPAQYDNPMQGGLQYRAPVALPQPQYAPPPPPPTYVMPFPTASQNVGSPPPPNVIYVPEHRGMPVGCAWTGNC